MPHVLPSGYTSDSTSYVDPSVLDPTLFGLSQKPMEATLGGAGILDAYVQADMSLFTDDDATMWTDSLVQSTEADVNWDMPNADR